MSGGHFDYQQFRLDQIADQIDQLIISNDDKDAWGFSRNYSVETINKFKETVFNLRKTAKQIQRIDWLVSGDDGEGTFHMRWEEEGCG